MADFRLWGKDTLIKFAEVANEKLEKQAQEIADLQDALKTVQLAWRNALKDAKRGPDENP